MEEKEIAERRHVSFKYCLFLRSYNRRRKRQKDVHQQQSPGFLQFTKKISITTADTKQT